LFENKSFEGFISSEGGEDVAWVVL
jgi:hypothetical protein